MGGKGSGNRTGARHANSYGSWLTAAKVGDVLWLERDSRNASGDAVRAGRTVKAERYLALHPATRKVVRITKVTVVS